MNKFIIMLIILCSSFMINTSNVYADNNTSGVNSADVSVGNADCDSAFGDPTNPDDFAYYLQKALDILRFAGIIIAIAMTIKDLVVVVSDQKNDAFKKIGITTLKRIIYATLIFILPSLINFVFGILGFYSTCGIK